MPLPPAKVRTTPLQLLTADEVLHLERSLIEQAHDLESPTFMERAVN